MWDNSTKIAEYEYNADGTKKHVKNGSLYTEYAYDADRNLTGLKTLLGAETIVDNRYTYDGNGDRLEKYQKHGTTRYGYDSMRRLAKVEYPNTTEELFYDKAGNRTRRLYNGAEELYQYDKRNRLTAHTKGGVTSQYEYDNAGNLLKDDNARYEYDAFNRNTKVETFNGNIQINRYDAEGLRHEMEENGRLVSFIFRGDEVVAEESQEDRIRYIRTSVLLASDAEGARTYYHYASDEMGSVTHVVDGESEEILNHYEYDAWGNLTTCEEKVHNRFKFNGQQYDPISQQYYLRARYYNPVIGRFTQEDSYNVDGLNLYAYCRNNPVYYVDPSGNICETAANKITDKLNNNQATRNEQKKLAAYLRNKDRNGGLTDAERSTLNKIDGYTYLNRYEGQTFYKCPPEGYYQDPKGDWHRPNGDYASHKEVGLRSKEVPHNKGDVLTNYKTGKAAEQRLADIVGGESQKYFSTSQGKRFVDQFSDGIAHESKAGYTTLTDDIKTQIAKDVEIRKNNEEVTAVYWHFFKSDVTGKCGASAPLLKELANNDIVVRYED